MAKNKQKKDKWWFWFTVGLVACFLIAPNATVNRVLLVHIPPFEFTFLRAALIIIVALPLIISAIPKFTKRNMMYTLGAGICLTIATLCLTYAIKYSDASYVAVMGLLSPILLVILSSRLMGDKISLRAFAGVSLAAAGALLVVVAPLAFSGNTNTHFYPLATTLMLINSLFFTFGILFSRKSNEAGMPLAANSGLLSIVIAVVAFIGMYCTEGLPTNIMHFSFNTWLGIFYSGVVVVFFARILNIASYERIGAAATGGLSYLSSILSIVIPILLLGEQLSSTIIIGGIVILVGVYLTEKHRAKHQHHRYIQAH